MWSANCIATSSSQLDVQQVTCGFQSTSLTKRSTFSPLIILMLSSSQSVYTRCSSTVTVTSNCLFLECVRISCTSSKFYPLNVLMALLSMQTFSWCSLREQVTRAVRVNPVWILPITCWACELLGFLILLLKSFLNTGRRCLSIDFFSALQQCCKHYWNNDHYWNNYFNSGWEWISNLTSHCNHYWNNYLKRVENAFQIKQHFATTI